MANAYEYWDARSEGKTEILVANPNVFYPAGTPAKEKQKNPVIKVLLGIWQVPKYTFLALWTVLKGIFKVLEVIFWFIVYFFAILLIPITFVLVVSGAAITSFSEWIFYTIGSFLFNFMLFYSICESFDSTSLWMLKWSIIFYCIPYLSVFILQKSIDLINSLIYFVKKPFQKNIL